VRVFRKTDVKAMIFSMVAILLCSAFAQATEKPSQHILSAYIIPNTEELTHAAARLHDVLADNCANPATFDKAKVKPAFDRLAAQWAYVEVLRFGPIIEANRFERFFMWPDPAGRMAKQVRQVVNAKDAGVLDESKLAGRSVVLQGLPALEYILFELDLPVEPVFRCGYAMAIAARLNATAREIATGWQLDAPFGKALSEPKAGRVYHSQREVLAEIIKALTTALKFTRDTKLLPALGDNPQAARYQRAVLWRSSNSFTTLGATLDAVAKLYQAAGFKTLLKDDPNQIGNNIQFELERAQEIVSRLQGINIAQAFTDPAAREDIAYVALLLDSLNTRVTQELAPAVGVGVGFNALDGD
jgi:predicted lipoprotein